MPGESSASRQRNHQRPRYQNPRVLSGPVIGAARRAVTISPHVDCLSGDLGESAPEPTKLAASHISV